MTTMLLFFIVGAYGLINEDRLHFIFKSTKKQAEDAARTQGGGNTPVHHMKHKNLPGYYNHFHPTRMRGGQLEIRDDGSHFQYPS